MKLVIDSNRLRADALRAFLQKSPANVAVLTDYAAMEAYKGDTLVSIFKSMAILSEFPEQVLVLKGTRAACGLRGRPAGLQRRLIDAKQTAGFPEFVQNLRRAESGNVPLQRQLLELGKEASAHINRMLVDAETTGDVIDELASLYSKEERRAIRVGEKYSAAFMDKTMKNIMSIAGSLFSNHPNARQFPSFEELPYTFIFRAALCTYLLVLDWSAKGSAKDARPERLRNDFVDMNFVAFGTYFDGLMTADAKVQQIHKEARTWLMALFECLPPNGLGYSFKD